MSGIRAVYEAVARQFARDRSKALMSGVTPPALLKNEVVGADNEGTGQRYTLYTR